MRISQARSTHWYFLSCSTTSPNKHAYFSTDSTLQVNHANFSMKGIQTEYSWYLANSDGVLVDSVESTTPAAQESIQNLQAEHNALYARAPT